MCVIVIFVVWEGEDGGKERFNVVRVHEEGWVGGILYCMFFYFLFFILILGGDVKMGIASICWRR